MLYWMETVIIAFWTILPDSPDCRVTSWGPSPSTAAEQAATRRMLCGFFTLIAGMFILVHLVFLWVLFSGEWLKKVHGLCELLGRIVRRQRAVAGADLHVRRRRGYRI